jgi:uncharacterized protein YktB (UPF0637 family)
MLCEVKQKFFGRVGATKFRRANAPKKNFCLVSDSIRLKSKVAFKYVCLNSKLLFWWFNLSKEATHANFGRLLEIYCFGSTVLLCQNARNFVKTCLTELE